MPIVLAPLNQELTIKKVMLDDKTKKHLESMGITINTKLKVLSSTNGNIIIAIKDFRLALDVSVAKKIFVC